MSTSSDSPDPRQRLLHERDIRLLTSPVTLAALGALLASGAAAAGWNTITQTQLFEWCHAAHGANVHRAIDLVFATGLMAFVIPLASISRTLLLCAMLLEVAALSIALALVADDSATYSGNHCPSFMPEFFAGSFEVETMRAGVGYLYFLWGAVLAVLVLQFGRVLRQPNRSTPGLKLALLDPLRLEAKQLRRRIHSRHRPRTWRQGW
jgi:hypothetical protein